jgi:hypothetical protein
MDKFLDSLYTKLVLRDVLGKMVPGSILVVTLYISLLSQASNLHEAVQAMRGVPAKDWIPLLAAGWLTGLALQGLGGWLPNWWWVPYIRYSSAPAPSCRTPDDPDGVKKFYRRVVHFEKLATESQRQLFERFTVLHEASGNSQLALALATVILFVWQDLLHIRIPGWQDLLRIHEYKNLCLYLAMLGAVYSLARMHRACVELKMSVFSEVMAQRPNWVEEPHAERNKLRK